MPLSRCGCFANVRQVLAAGRELKNGSATSGTVIGWYQLPHVRDRAGLRRVVRVAGAVKCATAAHW